MSSSALPLPAEPGPPRFAGRYPVQGQAALQSLHWTFRVTVSAQPPVAVHSRWRELVSGELVGPDDPFRRGPTQLHANKTALVQPRPY